MSNDPAFLFYPGDYLRDTQCLSEKVQVAYDRIICEHMRNICIRQKQLNFFTKRLSEDEKDELLMVLTKIDGGYQIKWVAESIIKRRTYSESRRKNRLSKTDKHMSNISQTYDSHMDNENENVIEYNNVIKNIEFEIFWNLYDKKVSKPKAEKLWNKLTDENRTSIMDYIPKYKLSQPDKAYRKNPDVFLRNSSWEDEIIISSPISDGRGVKRTHAPLSDERIETYKKL